VRRGPELVVLPDAAAAARRGAATIAAAARAAVSERGAFALAVSGGPSPLPMFEALGAEDVPWTRTGIWQVDERVAPEGQRDRNLTGLLDRLPPQARSVVRPMPVTDPDLEDAALRYAATLPPAFDLVHLGIGADGHTASLVAGDRALDVTDRDVVVTAVYQGRRRMTLTYPVLDRARFVLWHVTGPEKAGILPRLLASDPRIPGGRVGARRQLVVADEAAAANLGNAAAAHG
jgi:6-phosphogluconolactonase